MSNIRLKGALLDDETRCVHYHSPLDVVALQCYECRTFYVAFVARCTRLRRINR